MEFNCSTHTSEKLIIHMLGSFDIRMEEKSFLANISKRSYKTFDLLKLFITFKNKKILSETIMEKLWPDSELLDPKNALRTKIYRLRKMLDEMGILAREDREGFCRLDFQNGFYIFSLNDNCFLDTEEFSRYVKLGDSCKDSDPQQAIFYYQKALDLYKGEYLSENPYSEWAIPSRNYYHRLFFSALHRQLELLRDAKNYQQIIKTCEKAFMIEPYEEIIHVHYLNSLVSTEQSKIALSHYKYITNKLWQDLGVRPSAQMKEIYRQIKSRITQKKDLDYWEVLRDLTEEDPEESAFYCEIDEFKAIYNLEKRKSLRNPSSSFLGFINFLKNGGPLEPHELKNCITKTKKILLYSLRKGDVITQWNEYTLIFIVTETSGKNLDHISRRIINAYLRENPKEDTTIEIKFEPISEKGLNFASF